MKANTQRGMAQLLSRAVPLVYSACLGGLLRQGRELVTREENAEIMTHDMIDVFTMMLKLVQVNAEVEE